MYIISGIPTCTASLSIYLSIYLSVNKEINPTVWKKFLKKAKTNNQKFDEFIFLFIIL